MDLRPSIIQLKQHEDVRSVWMWRGRGFIVGSHIHLRDCDISVVCLWAWIHAARWAGSRRVRNRKQEVISQDDLYTLAVEYIKRTTTDTHLELCGCVCVCVQMEEEESIRHRQRSETWLYSPETKESQHSLCVCVLNSYFSVTVPTPAVSQAVSTAQHFLKTSQHPGKIKGNTGSTWINGRMVVCWQCVVRFPAIAMGRLNCLRRIRQNQ